MSESSAGGSSTNVSAAASSSSASVAVPAPASTSSSSVPRPPPAVSQPVRSPSTSIPSSSFPTYASSSRNGAAGSGVYFAPPNTSFLATDTAAAAAATASTTLSTSSFAASLPASFTSPHPFASSTTALQPPKPSTASSTTSPALHRPVTSTNAIIVSPRQRGNPVLAHIRNCPWEFAPAPVANAPPPPPFLADYLLGQTTCALYLSLRYHLLHPQYLLSRMQPLRSHYTLRLLLLQVDVDDSEPPLTEVTSACFNNGWTLLLGWSVEEIGRWLELFKVMESKGKESLEGSAGADAGDEERVRDVLGVVKGVNKTDTAVLMSTFGSLTALARASEAELQACVGMGAKKVKRLRLAFNQPFISSQAVRTVMGNTPNKPATPTAAAAAADMGEEKKEAGGSATKSGSEESDKVRSQKRASASQISLFAPIKKQKTGAIVRLDD